ncbi:patched domain-containing protein 3-like [Centruroides vittatus]|uniref:patched domain-containing protein 3-like n=1 Tax=Centruroides vittatus TaxID=120091 RepID=UPI00350F8C96
MALSIFIDYVYQITFFGGCLAMSGYREEKNLHAIFFTPVKLEERPSGFLRLIKYGCNTISETKMAFYKNKLGNILTFPTVKFIIILLYLLYFVGGIYSTKYIQASSGVKTPFHQNSYVLDYIRDEEKYYSAYKDRIHIVITSPLDYWNPQVQKDIENLMIELENSSHMAGSNYTESWLRFYLNFTKNPQFWISLRGYNLSYPEDFVDALHNVFLKIKWANSFEKDIIFSDDGTKILASRFFIQTKLTDMEKQIETFINLWNIIDKHNLPIQLFNYQFIFIDSIFELIPTATQSVAISSCVVILIFLIFIPNLFGALCIACTIASIEVTTMGYMSLWGVTFHPIGTILMIVVTGFCTDYAAHITCAYAKSKEKDPNQKLRDCLDAAGHAIVQGCLSTLLGVVLLIFTQYEVLNDMFKIFFLVMISSMIQGLFILPVILSLWDNFLLFLCRNNEKRHTVEEFPRHPNTREQLLE